MVVVVDDREPACGPARFLRQREGVCVRVARLGLGDYLVDDRLLVERKTFADFQSSVCDGRLLSQACRLVASPRPVALILEGAPTVEGVSREALQGALISVSVVLGIPVLRAMDAEESARLMVYASAQLTRHVHGAVARKGYRPRGRRRQQLHVLQGLPGVGPERAERLLAAFGSVAAVFAAEERDLVAVPGMGQTTVQRIHSLIHGSFSPASSRKGEI